MKKIIVFLFILFSIFTLSSCGKDESDGASQPNVETQIPGTPTPQPPQPTPVEITEEMLKALVFEAAAFDYDGSAHSIYVQNVPEGVTVTYKNNEKVEPGRYYVSATITYGDLSVKKSAYLTINRKKPVLVAEENQVVFLYGGNVYPSYELDNDEQKVAFKVYKGGVEVSSDVLYTEGDYTVDIIAQRSNLYEESTVTVNVKVVNSLYNISFVDQNVIWDGNDHTLNVSGDENLPEGYTVAYDNNVAKDAGAHRAYAYVKDASGKVVETHAATLTIEYPKHEAFETYLDSFFYEYLEEDLLSINIFCENPSKWGFDIASYEATWYSYEPSTEEDFIEAKDYFNELYDELKAFEDQQLSPLQRVAYRKVEDFLLENIAIYEIEDIEFMRIVYVDSFGGYVADFATYMEAYSYRSEEDVLDVIGFINSTETAFPSYLGFVKDKADNGYALSNYTVTEMRKFLFDILEQGEEYYLADAICARINAVDSSILSDEKKADYCAQVVAGMDGAYLNGVKALYDGLADYLHTLPEDKTGYWSTYETGKDLFLSELKSLLGFDDFDIDEYIAELEAEFARTNALSSSAQNDLVKRFGVSTNEQLYSVLESYPIFSGTPDEMMVFLKEFAPHVVPQLNSEPNIVIKEMDEASAKVSNAVAYYMKSALDNTGSENITLNPLKLGDANDVLGTLAHEGYPGHLYAYVYSKEIGQHELSTIMTSTAHAEGWATYVELALYEYAMERTEDPNLLTVLNYLHANQLNGYLIYAMFDAYIHYKGWTDANIANWLQRNYGYDKESAAETGKEIYNLLIEMPVTYAAYAYGKLYFVKLHDQAREILGAFYNEVEFNGMLLSRGWTDLGELERTYNEYMIAKCHKHGIEFNA